MKVVYIHQYFLTRSDMGGTRSYEFARKLIDEGHEVVMISATPDMVANKNKNGEKITREMVDGIDVIRANIPYSTKQSVAERIYNFIKFLFIATKYAVCEKNVDLIFATSTPLTVAVPGIVAALKHRKPFIFEVRDLWPDAIRNVTGLHPAIYWPSKLLELSAYKTAKKIIVLAPGCIDDIAKMGFSKNKIEFISNSADLDLFVPEKNKKYTKEITLVFTGAHGLANGLPAVIKAAKVLQNRGEKGIKFLFIGRGSQKSMIEEKSQEWKLENVEFRDSVPKTELAEIVRNADVGMMILKNVEHFYYGTSPNKFFDYLASGIPVLNNYPGWVADIISENKCGIAVEPDNPKAFADAVVYLRDHPEEREKMGKNSRLVAERDFSRIDKAQKFAELIKNVGSKS